MADEIQEVAEETPKKQKKTQIRRREKTRPSASPHLGVVPYATIIAREAWSVKRVTKFVGKDFGKTS